MLEEHQRMVERQPEMELTEKADVSLPEILHKTRIDDR